MKNKKIFIALGVILGIIMALVATYFILLTPSSKSNKVITFTVKKGDGKEKIVDNLKDAKLIKSKYATFIYIVLSGKKNLQAGSYEFSRNMSVEDIIYGIYAGLSVFVMCFKVADGIIRGFIIMGIAVGAFLYFKFLSSFYIRWSVRIIKFLLKPACLY